MKNTKVKFRRLAMNREIVHTLRGRELAGVAAGWECSAKTSGNILCRAPVSGDPETCNAGSQ